MKGGAASLLAALTLAGCGVEGGTARTEALAFGVPESGHPAVYLLYRLDGLGCTAALIAPRVALTARHCVMTESDTTVAPEQIRLYAGATSSTFYAEHAVSRVEIIPGSTATLRDGTASDLALLVLTGPALEPPYLLARETSGEALVGLEATAIGFGDTVTGEDGDKRSATAIVEAYDPANGLYWVPPTLCDGDSGGPLIGPDDRIWGVASFTVPPTSGASPMCGSDDGAYNELTRHLGWIDSVLASVSGCVPSSEVCNGADDDCDGELDEGCLSLGASCETSDRCTGGLCADTPAGRICTRACDPLAPSCAAGSHCALAGCQGYCVPGALGASVVGTACALDSDCTTGLCRDPGDGERRCLDFCRADANECLAREVCAPLDVPLGEGCGGCIAAASASGPRGLGEPCSDASECRSGICAVRGGIGECATACEAGETCAEGRLCRQGLCVTDRRQPLGGACLDDLDCPSDAFCDPEGRYCSRTCAALTECPSGLTCDLGRGACIADGGLDGSPCLEADDCLSGLCGSVDGSAVCLRLCDHRDACGAGYECRRVGERAVCARAPSGGCSASPAALRPSRAASLGAWLLALVTAMRFRRTRGR